MDNYLLHINEQYLELLKIMSSLSGLFSESEVPYLYYRNAEHLFYYALNAKNLSREDTAFDALLSKNGMRTGVGLKTFICPNQASVEKVAEFNQLSHTFKSKDLDQLARMISDARNQRILMAKRMYAVDNAIYHLVARRKKELRIFEENYDLINLDRIKVKKYTKSSLSFSDHKNDYVYNFSKSTLFKKFVVSEPCQSIDVQIIEEPYQLLFNLKSFLDNECGLVQKALPYVILPLYSTRTNEVAEHSGLNQWNAHGCRRSLDEVYIPIPKFIHRNYPDFFPSREQVFELMTPDGKSLQAKICQSDGKALMSNPNSALADWLLRQLLNLKEGELATSYHLKLMDCDSVKITKISDTTYQIDKARFGAYREFSQVLSDGHE